MIITVHYSPQDSNPNPERGVIGGLQTLLSLDISNEDAPIQKNNQAIWVRHDFGYFPGTD